MTTLFQLGDYLERKALRKTQSEIQSLISLKPKVAPKLIAGEIKTVTIEDVVIDDLLVVRAGSSVSVDGVIVKGEGALNEASITGESNFVYKHIQDPIYTGTILEDGYLEMKVTKVGKDTTFAKIIALIEKAQDAKSEVEKVIDKFARVYTPLVIVFAMMSYLIFKDVKLSITILVLACPGALVIGVPVVSVTGIGKAAKLGIYF